MQFHAVVFSDDWGRHPSSCQHIFRYLLDRVAVTWVNTVGLRTPRLSIYDLKRAFQVLGKWTAPPAQTKSPRNPNVLSPKMFPSFRNRVTACINQKILQRAVIKALSPTTEDSRTILVSTLPFIPRLFSSTLFDRTVYYCVDDFTNWPGVDGVAMRQLEEETLVHCDLLIATSDTLLRSRGARCRRAHLLLHGVDFDHFSQIAKLSPPAELAALPKPVIGFWGVFDDRIDVSILFDLAKRFPTGSIAVLGPIDRDLKPFEHLANVHFFGSTPYAELPRWASGFDVCILPYKVEVSTQSINPLKLREYLATGKPVVATALPEAVRLSRFMRIASRHDFPGVVNQALEADASSTAPDGALMTFLKSESWENKAEEFWRIVTDGL
ncbi:MAG: glycosyltransferase [Acidobacteriota bacterium]|jgi:glycosyltransferase involved in cell wall biosynthesis|nr:glycosyltransferase [Acidobacteriota bacterium]